MLQPVATDGLFAAADSGTATPQQSDNGTNNHADNTAYVGEHVMASTTAKSHGKAARIAIITIFAVLLAALIAYFFVGRWYFQDKAAPGVHLGNVSVMGQTREELANTVKQRLNNTTVTFIAEGNSVKASLKDLGVTVDTDKTVDALLNAKTGDVAKLNIFDQPHIALTATTDKETAEQFVTAGLVDEADRAQIATVVYNKSTKQFDYTAGQDGKGPDTNVVNAAVKEAVATPGENATVPVKLQTAKNPIDDASAQQTQFDANARLGLKLTVDNGVNKSVTIPADTIASFLKPTANKAEGTMSLVVDRDAITKYVTSDSVTKELTVPKVTREVYITPKDEGGVEIGADKTLGVDGIEVTGAGDAPERLATAIEQNQSTDSTVAVKDSPYDVKQVEVPHNFDTANGDKWVHVDLTNQTATAYQGTTVVKKFNIASGKPTADGSMLSDTGTFYVYLKYESQTMVGEGYNQPGTPWVSYYNGGEALHGVPAYMWGEHPIYVQQGIPGSHGCINMQVADAKWMYDFATIGQRVLKGGRGEGVVDRDLGAVLVGNFGGGRVVGDVEQRVGRGLDPHILVVLGGQCGFHGFQIGDVHHVEAHTPRHEHLGEQAVGAAVHIVAEQDVVAGLDGGAQQHVDGGQARGEAQRVLAAFHGGELLVEAGASGVDGAGVVVASPEAQHAILLESGGGEDRRDDRTGGRVGLLAGVDGASGDVGVGELGVVFSGHDIGFLSGSFRIRR